MITGVGSVVVVISVITGAGFAVTVVSCFTEVDSEIIGFSILIGVGTGFTFSSLVFFSSLAGSFTPAVCISVMFST